MQDNNNDSTTEVLPDLDHTEIVVERTKGEEGKYSLKCAEGDLEEISSYLKNDSIKPQDKLYICRMLEQLKLE